MKGGPFGPASHDGFQAGTLTVLAVGDPGRRAAGRAIFRTLACSFLFSVAAGPAKETPLLYDHAPWLNDPYDTAVSFAMFFVPLLTIGCAIRVLLCRRFEPLPASRLEDLLRGCRVLLAAVGLTAASEWISVAVGVNRAQWDGATWLQVAVLGVITVMTGYAGLSLHRAAFPRKREPTAGADATDWLGDIVAVAVRGGTRLGPFGSIVLTAVRWTDRNLVAAVRRHPVRSAVLVATGFGVLVGSAQSLSEGYYAATALMVVILLACGMYPLLMAAGAYLGVVRSGRRLGGARRRAADASVLACAGVLVIFAFRDSLWWVVGSRPDLAGIAQLCLLLIIFAVPFFVLPFAAETLLRLHDEPLWPRYSRGHGTMEPL